MNAVWQLPFYYRLVCRLDLQNDKRLVFLVNGLCLLIGVIMLIPLFFSKFLYHWMEQTENLLDCVLPIIVLIFSMIVYMVLHEWIHGLCIRYFSGRKANYGFTGLYAFAASEAYFPKKPYIIIALAPIVVWGVILTVLFFFVTDVWFWVVYLIQVVNISGAAGDLYVTWRLSKLPKEILVRDSGVVMEVYSAE